MTKLELNTQGLRKGGTLQALLGADLAASATPPSPEGGGEVPAAAPTPESGGEPSPAAPPRASAPRRRRAQPPNARAGARQPSEPQPTPDLQDQPFWAIGALEQTSVAVDPILLTTINALAADLELPVATVFAAIVHQGLPADIDAAADAVLLEQADHPGRGREYNLRLPVELKARLAALLKGASVQIGRANRADLINAALRAGMPQDTDQARELCVTYRRRQTLARRAEPVRAAHQ